MRFLRPAIAAVVLCSLSFAQQQAVDAPKPAASQAEKPPVASSEIKLNHFDPALVDKSKDPCNDFYSFVCSKWQAENPIPPDQSVWSTSSNLALWNQAVLRETMEAAAKGGADRDAVHQKIGDYYGSCMDDKTVNSKAAAPIKPALDAIAAMKSKKDLAATTATLHKMYPGSTTGEDNHTYAPVLGFGPIQDFKDSTLVVAGVDQGGMAM